MDRSLKFIIAVSGIFICYLFFGIVQEDITRSHYKLPDGGYEIFVYPTALVAFFCCTNFLCAKMLSVSVFNVNDDTTATIYYSLNALAYLLAMICGNMSLQFIDYPTHVVGKTIKPIFVMIIGGLMGKKNYSKKKYFFVVLIIIGSIMFIYKDKGEPAMKKGFSLGMGELMLLLSLVMDGFVAAVQDRMIAEHQTTSISLMLNVNKWACLYAIIIIFITGELFRFVDFVHRYPYIIWKLLMLSLASSLGQYFIFLLISEFGPLVCSIATTLRKFFSMLISVVIMRNPLLPRQWLATFMIFSGLLLDIYYGKKSPSRTAK